LRHLLLLAYALDVFAKFGCWGFHIHRCIIAIIVLYNNNVIYYKYVDIEAATAKPKISFLSNFPLRGGGCGGSRK
jgi:hypothetical protein